MAFYHEMLHHKNLLNSAGVVSVIPEPDELLNVPGSEEEFQRYKLQVSKRHIRRIRDSKTFGILVVNCDKYGTPDYIGANTFAEIAIAFAHYKRIFLLQGVPEFYQDELLAWQVTPLWRQLSPLITDYREAITYSGSQLSLLFGS